MLFRWIPRAAFIVLGATGLLCAQEANYGFSIPVTLSGSAMYTHRLQSEDPGASPATAGFRGVLYPTLKLGSHWFGYAAVQLEMAPYFYYDAFESEHEFYSNVLQAFIGYSFQVREATMVVKAGRLSSAFGSFPLRYDDKDNPLLDQPLPYITELPFAANQLPCGVNDFGSHYYGGSSGYACWYSKEIEPGLTPVTLYGLPGVEADFSGYHFDGRIQITSGSPAYPQPFRRGAQYAQWTAGGGYQIRQGFRVGVSGFRGPYLDPEVVPWLPAGTSVRDFPASGVGADVQWAHGRWSANGEWQRFRFDQPNFTEPPSLTAGYAELKAVLTPRYYLAGRVGWIQSGSIRDRSGQSASEFFPTMGSYEIGAGCWLNRYQLLKVGYEWLEIDYQRGTRNNVVGVQLVTSFRPVSWAFR